MLDSSFLCLDIGTAAVRGCAHRVRSARIDKSAVFSVEGTDTVFALKSVIDELERQIGAHFDTAYITGNFGDAAFTMTKKCTQWPGEHKITASDVLYQIGQITPPDGFAPMHIIPMRYYTPTDHDTKTPVGHTDRALVSIFSAIFFERERVDNIITALRRAHIQPAAFYDTHFLISATLREKNENTMIIDFGDAYTTASIWTERGPVLYKKIPHGGANITRAISAKLNLDMDAAARIKRAVANLTPMDMDRFTPADAAYAFTRADISDIVIPEYIEIISQIKSAAANAIEKYHPRKIIITGGGAEITGGVEFIENAFSIPVVKDSDAAARALAAYVWGMFAPRAAAFHARAERMGCITRIFGRMLPRKKTKKKTQSFIPIMPSTLCFDMRRPDTYALFKSGGISIIHVDIMDGLYVDRIVGGIDELRQIRAMTDAHLHVHLMTESPDVWAADAIDAGANTIIVSTNTSGLRAALHKIRAAGRRAGVALNPESPVSILTPIIKDVDEIMVMSVNPGAAGQPFDPGALKKISILQATRKKYNLNFTISVDGGINAETAAGCWTAGANLLVSGSYLAKSHDFPLAVQSLLPGGGDIK